MVEVGCIVFGVRWVVFGVSVTIRVVFGVSVTVGVILSFGVSIFCLFVTLVTVSSFLFFLYLLEDDVLGSYCILKSLK